MPPASSDSPVGWADGPVDTARRVHPADPLHSPPADLSARNARETERGAKTRSVALEALLVDLGPQIRRGPAPAREVFPSSSRLLPTGLSDLDARLGGGFPHGRLSEICGAPSSGRTSLTLRLLAKTQESGVLAAWVDLADAFDPASALASGVALERLLWARPRRLEDAIRSSERLLRTEGFELVVLDLSVPARLPSASSSPSKLSARRPPVQDVTWLRLARLAASTRTALILLSSSDAADPSSASPDSSAGPSAGGPSTGSRADLVLEMQAQGSRFVGPPALLEGLETTALVRRHRSRPIGIRIPLSISSSSSSPS